MKTLEKLEVHLSADMVGRIVRIPLAAIPTEEIEADTGEKTVVYTHSTNIRLINHVVHEKLHAAALKEVVSDARILAQAFTSSVIRGKDGSATVVMKDVEYEVSE